MELIEVDSWYSNETVAQFKNNTTDVTQLLLEKLGPRRRDLASVILLTIVYSIIFLSGVVGNVCTCLVIAKTHSMQTTTNYYLFSLAVSDLLLILIGLPPELYSIWEAYPWRLGEAFCYLRQSVLESTSYASVLTITAFTVERYLAICHPLLAHKISALSRAVKIIISIWAVSLMVALPYAAHTRIYYQVRVPETNEAVPESLMCSIPYHFLSGFMYYMFQVSTFIFFITPVTVIIILYILIGVSLRRSPLARGASDERSYSSMKSSSKLPQQPRKVVIRMLIAVTVAFIVCWAPFHAQRLMTLYVPHWTPHLLEVQSHIFYISGVLYFVSSTVNPILYNVISKRYRAAFKQIIFPCCYTKPVPGTNCVPRHSERSKSQAMVVLRNGHDSLRVMFRQDSNDTATNYETIPLNGSLRHHTLQSNDLVIPEHSSMGNSSSSGGSADVIVSQSYTGIVAGQVQTSIAVPPSKRFSFTGKDRELKQDDYVITNRGAEAREKGTGEREGDGEKGEDRGDGNPCIVSRDDKTAAALRKAEKPRKSYAHQVNGRVSFKQAPPSCDCDAVHTTTVR
ncbi:pyrokinin-1 receptor [Aplysia californica]|uniref:Pyrokinin-1 receptor n=1 Tax=Aplysia californica TaxID=6500 RepID=A0ABM0JTP8_APLCA|nr:pyrokinin-1 receptor [Aplysia californica]XP_012939584.1 pyrokinin-1 receptor [Aplysia californica]XP_012939585.1 pyrokinin-1 receptor [Aplysia californica]XP_035826389.1 pyrokinin-1 receptor [Aplysia californica]